MDTDNKSLEELQQENASLKEALKQVLYQNEMLLSWVNGGVITMNREGICISANEFALSSHGFSEEELVGKKYHDTCHHTLDDGGEYPWDFCPVFAAIEDGSSHHVTNDLFWKNDGSSFLVDYIVCPIRDTENNISGATVIFRNLTEQRLQEAKRIHGLKLESIGELSAGIAHEINTPIQFIGSNLSFLEECFEDLFDIIKEYQALKEALPDDDASKALLEKITNKEDDVDLEYVQEEAPKAIKQTTHGVDRVTELVQGLKGFAHSAESDKKTGADINDIINNSLIVCKNTYKYVAELKLELGELPSIKVNQGDIGQVILNLIVNAAHAIEEIKGDSDKFGTIIVSSKHENNNIIVEITDTGGGIPETVKDRIFDPFFTTKEVGKGSGQGLAISRTIIHEKHGGEMNFVTTQGEGTTFTVSLPIGG